MNFPFYIAKRYLFSKSSTNAINIITIIAAIGVVVGAMALFIVLSGFAGLKDFSLQFTNVFDSDLKIMPASGKTITFNSSSEVKLQSIEGVAAYSKIIEERVFLHFRDKNEIAYIKGVDENYAAVNPVDSMLVFDSWFSPNEKEVVVGIGTSLKLVEGASEKNIRSQLSALFSEDVLIKNRIQQNDALYKMLNTENIAVYLIFTLVLIIALFNVIGSIIMMILDKRKNIKTLFNIGANLKDIRRIFFLQGALMTFLGGSLGILLGVIVVWAQLRFEFINITASLPYPVKLKAINILIVFVTITTLGIVASKIASSRVREKLIH